MIAWLGYIFDITAVSGKTVEQHVSSIKRAYETDELAPPGKPLGSKMLYHKVRNVIDSFTVRRRKQGKPPPKQHDPTPDYIMCDFCKLARNRLDQVQRCSPALLGRLICEATAALANGWTYFLIWRPIVCTAIAWSAIIPLEPPQSR